MELYVLAAASMLELHRQVKLTAAGRRQLAEETTRWGMVVRAVNRVLRPMEE